MTELLWYLTRAAGLVSLVLLSSSMILGLLTAGRAPAVGTPAFVRAALHRTLSLVMVVGIAVHVIVAVAETYVDIGWISALVPFTSGYERLWVGFGTVAFDLLLIVAITSILRDRIPARAWRLVHWTAYALWPIALLHGLTTGSDQIALWTISGVCVAGVVGAGVRRLGRRSPDSVRQPPAALAWR